MEFNFKYTPFDFKCHITLRLESFTVTLKQGFICNCFFLFGYIVFINTYVLTFLPDIGYKIFM